MPARSHVIRTLLLVSLCSLLLAPRAEAGHRRLFADLDADGRRDHVTVDNQRPWIVRIWLSATRSTHIIRSSQPLRGITAVDLNGDRRPELIFSNLSHGLQVWTSAPGGFVAYPHRPRPPTDDISGSTRHRVDDQSDELPPGIAGASSDARGRRDQPEPVGGRSRRTAPPRPITRAMAVRRSASRRSLLGRLQSSSKPSLLVSPGVRMRCPVERRIGADTSVPLLRAPDGRDEAMYASGADRYRGQGGFHQQGHRRRADMAPGFVPFRR
jgi:hypothetical protein